VGKSGSALNSSRPRETAKAPLTLPLAATSVPSRTSTISASDFATRSAASDGVTAETAARAAELSGVQIPDVRSVDGTTMRLNGIGLRTYSFLRIPIYVAGLYLEQPSKNPDAILHSTPSKLLDIRFLRDVDADEARKSWRDGLEHNCKSPCSLDPSEVKRFLSAVPFMRRGDETRLLFTPRGVEFKINGAPIGVIADLHFAEIILATFIGPEPPTARLKRELLGGPG
jgi:chalcone isomerase-like protein